MANHFILDGGTGDGSAWDNAWDALPATLVRGDTYYVGDGSYALYTADDAVDGTSLITIKKATAADHGTETGWSAAYGDGAATFDGLDIRSSYWVIDGQAGQWASDWPGYVAHGFKVLTNGNWENAYCLRIYSSGAALTNITISHVNAAFSNTTTWEHYANVLYVSGTGAGIAVDHCWFHNAGAINTYLVSSTGSTWEYNFFEECGVAANGDHSEVFRFNEGTSGGVWRYNVMRKFQSTGGLILAGGNSNIKIYGNIFYNVTGYSGGGNGVLNSFAAGEEITGCVIYNNTFANIPAGGMVATVGTWGADLLIRNNLFFNVTGLDINATGRDYNWYYGCGTITETHKQDGTGDPFINVAGGDFHLTAATDAGDSTIGVEYDEDPDGVTRNADAVWDRGAYEYTAGVDPPGFHVYYAANGALTGTVPTDATDYPEDDPVTVAGNTGSLARESYWAFMGWNTQADGLGTAYQPGAVMTMPAADATLYAQWRLKCALIAG